MHFRIKVLCCALLLVLGIFAFSSIAHAADNSWLEQFKEASASAWEKTKEKAPEVWDSTKKKAGTFYDAAKEKAPEVIEKAKDSIAAAQEKTSDFLQSQEEEFWERTERQIYGEDYAASNSENTPDSDNPASIPDDTPALVPTTPTIRDTPSEAEDQEVSLPAPIRNDDEKSDEPSFIGELWLAARCVLIATCAVCILCVTIVGVVAARYSYKHRNSRDD